MVVKRVHISWNSPFCFHGNSTLRPHQVVRVIQRDFSYGGTARVREVGITVVNRERRKTCNTSERVGEAVFCFSVKLYHCMSSCSGTDAPGRTALFKEDRRIHTDVILIPVGLVGVLSRVLSSFISLILWM